MRFTAARQAILNYILLMLYTYSLNKMIQHCLSKKIKQNNPCRFLVKASAESREEKFWKESSCKTVTYDSEDYDTERYKEVTSWNYSVVLPSPGQGEA